MIRRHPFLALGLVAALAVPGASAFAASNAASGSIHPAAESCEAQSPHRCQLEGKIVSVAGPTFVLRLNGQRGITDTVILVSTSTPTSPVTVIQPRGATLTPGEQVHVVALRTGAHTFTARRVIVQRPAAEVTRTPQANEGHEVKRTPKPTEAPEVTRTPEPKKL